MYCYKTINVFRKCVFFLRKKQNRKWCPRKALNSADSLHIFISNSLFFSLKWESMWNRRQAHLGATLCRNLGRCLAFLSALIKRSRAGEGEERGRGYYIETEKSQKQCLTTYLSWMVLLWPPVPLFGALELFLTRFSFHLQIKGLPAFICLVLSKEGTS